VLLLFAATLFCSALLLFQVQPMVGKMLLPKLGGAPAVWNACMVFFQAALLAGYAYSHATSAWLGSRRQALLHLPLLFLPLLVLPIAIADSAFRATSALSHPVVLVLVQLTLAVGLPFFIVSTTAPLLQRWFADTSHPSAHDPYFLYGASNLGSILGLLAYPLLIEPMLPLGQQSKVWSWGYAVYGVLVVLCAASLLRQARGNQSATIKLAPGPIRTYETISWRRRVRWVILAFIPSSMLLASTTSISTDIAPIPLLWIIPLALYLLTFILVFSRRPLVPHWLACRLLPPAVLLLTLMLVTRTTSLLGVPVWVLLIPHLAAFFLAAMVGHGELARDRPSAGHLTEFYLWMSAGGVLGGVFNALIAPILFRYSGLIEYPLIIVLACLIRPTRVSAGEFDASDDSPNVGSRRHEVGPRNAWDVILPVAVGGFTLGLIYLADNLGLEGPLKAGLVFGLPCALIYSFAERPVRFGLGIAALFLAATFSPREERLFLERNFFGVVKVVDMRSPDGDTFRTLFHGNTIHGQMSLDRTDSDGRRLPLTYYHPTGPIGLVCTSWFANRPAGQRVGAVGLGTGSLAYYARPGDSWVFFEIDPVIERVAEDPRYFTFMSQSRAGMPRVVLGDAYLQLQDEQNASFDFLILDAFSSDAIPVHLLTREAIRLYLDKLRPGGIIAFHVSNRYLNLRPILARLAEDAGLIPRAWLDSGGEKIPGKLDSDWVIMARREEDFGTVVWPKGVDKPHDDRWELIRPRQNTPLWTTEFSNLLSAFRRED
jgi:hypothetical protein